MSVNFTAADRVGGIGGYIGGIGTLLGLGTGNGILGGMNASYVTKEDAQLMRDLAYKDSEIALLKADQASEVKMTEVYKQAHSEIAALRDKVDVLKDQQTAWNANQGIVNAQVAANIAVAQNQISDINGMLGNLTKTIIPIDNVCPEPMKRYNSWTTPTTTNTGG